MSDETSITEGEIHDILRNDRRRAVIEFLSERGGHTTIRDLSEHIATLESGESPPPRNVRQSVYVSLHQTHLPKLEGLSVVDYDTDSKNVELREQATCVEAYMDQTTDETQIPVVVFVVGLLGVALGTVSFAGFAPGSGSGSGVWTVLLFVAVVALSGYQLWQRR